MVSMQALARLRRPVLVLFLVLGAVPVLAQQTGSISGKVTASDGSPLPGVTVEARSDVLPGPRVIVTNSRGEYRFPTLPPGTYSLKFDLSGMKGASRNAQVQLDQVTVVDVSLGIQAASESVTVTAEATLVDKNTATISSGVSTKELQALPRAQDYRDLQKYIPAVQYTEDTVRGPSSGGSGQDNVYLFDGANVSLPQYGNLSAEPASYDIAQVTVINGGARAVDFNRSGGFLIDSVTKSGTSTYHGDVSYQFQTKGMSASLNSGILSRYEQDRSWLNTSLSGPIIQDHLFFYGSYYRPEQQRENRANLYGELPDYDSTRNEYFGKLTITPSQPLLINLSYRDSKRVDKSDLFASNAAPTTGTGAESRLRIGTAEGSWVINQKSYATFKYSHFENPGKSTPDNISTAVPSITPGTQLDVANLDKLGRLTVPLPVAGNPTYNAFVAPLIEKYGYTLNGVKTGGGIVGFGLQFDEDNFFRDQAQIGYNYILGENVTHDLHAGFQWFSDRETLIRTSNGWGELSVPGGRLAEIPGTGKRAYYTATFQPQLTGAPPSIKSEYRSMSFEVNDQIRWKNVTVNLGLIGSRDTLYGQGLREDSSTLSGFVSAPGNKYEMYLIPWEKLLQPRAGVTWAYNGKDTVFASYARYNPSVSSLPRAASWDRNLIGGLFVDASFDQNGVLFDARQRGSSSGKLFVPDLTPRTVDEVLVGTAKDFTPRFSGRAYGRYRAGSHFWEDTNNNARIAFNPPDGIPRELYIPNLADQIAQIGSGSTYVIADLDGGYTRYFEGTLEGDWRGDKTFIHGTFTWTRYYGNFDQDDATGANNDQNTFIGSSNIADAAGRQLWNYKDGTLHGDRPYIIKLYGTRLLPWNASTGFFFITQAGQPWETNSYEPYRSLTTSTSDSNRFAERAGSRRTSSHWQVDLNYTQNFPIFTRYNLQLALDVFNIFDKQTGYNIEPQAHNSNYGNARSFYAPRRLQVAARFQL